MTAVIDVQEVSQDWRFDYKEIVKASQLFGAAATIKWSETQKVLWSTVVFLVESLAMLDEEILAYDVVNGNDQFFIVLEGLQFTLFALHRYLRSRGVFVEACLFASCLKSGKHYYGLWIYHRGAILVYHKRIQEVISSTMCLGEGLNGRPEAYLHDCLVKLYRSLKCIVGTFPEDRALYSNALYSK